MDGMLPLQQAELADKTVIIRADCNVPLRGNLADGITVADTSRLQRLLPTIDLVRSRGGRAVIISHLGRPDSASGSVQQIIDQNQALSLAPIASCLAELTGSDVAFIRDWHSDAAIVQAKIATGSLFMLENLRFDPGETANSPEFAAKLARLGQIYVNDAFSCSHRAHASITGLAKLLPAYAGLALLAELTALQQSLQSPSRPVIAIVGGAKVSTKIKTIYNLIDKTDAVVIAGGMANTFLLAQGFAVGKSLCEPDLCGVAGEIIQQAQAQNCELLLPCDAIVAAKLATDASARVAKINEIKGDDMILDCGPETIAAIETRLSQSKTVIWNGPLGAFEFPQFAKATLAIANTVARLTQQGQMMSVAGGGDTVAALNLAQLADKLSYLSMAGGAFLEWLEGRDLPGLVALAQQHEGK